MKKTTKVEKMTSYYIVKSSKDANELLEIVEAISEKEARDAVILKYIEFALSCKVCLKVLTKAAYDQLVA